MTFPKISIITPSYNSEYYITDAIESVLIQNYSNFEHIIIDGGSTDGTLNILKHHKHLIWISEPDEGQSDALNKGFKMASGDIIGWLNSDDIYIQGTLNKVVEYLKDPKIDAVYSNYYFVDSFLNIQKELCSHKPIKWLSLFHCYIPSTTFFFKRKILDNNIQIDKTLLIAMDKEFFANILFRGYRLCYINDFFAKFRWHSNNKSIDTKEIQCVRYKEGLITFNRYSKFKLPMNNFGVTLYKYLVLLLLIYRKILKMKAR